MKAVILEQLVATASQRTPEEALQELREDAARVSSIMEHLNTEDLQCSEPISCEEARLRLGLLEQLLCAVLAKAGNVAGPEIDSVRFATRLVQGMAAALPQGGEMPQDVLYFLTTSLEMILYRQFRQESKAAAESETAVQ